MAATVRINEYNAAGEVETTNIGDTDMGSVDQANLDPVANPIVPGENSFEKWQKLEVTAMGGSSKIHNLKVWRTGALGGAAAHKTNARTAAYGGAEAFATPTDNPSTVADQVMPASEPATANLGIGGALAGELTAAGYSDYLVHQMQTDAGDVAGSTSTLNYQYDEVA